MKHWHVSATVDLVAYSFSWVFVLVPLSLFSAREHQVAMLLLVVGLTFAHRHYTLPYIYLDREIFDRHPKRFTWFPFVAFVGFLVSPALWNTRGRLVVAAVVFAAGTWNVWHVYMQKFGLLRLYAAKSGSSVLIPRWVDRLLLVCWLPLYLVWLGPSYRDQLERNFPTVRDVALPLVDTLAELRSALLVPAAGCVLVGLGVFLYREWRSTGLRNLPRLAMACGTSALSASFLVFNPLHVFMAFAFSHAVEYMVFVWAYQRKRYGEALPHAPLLGRVLRHPWLAYGGFTLGITLPYLLARFYGYLVFSDATNPTFLGATVERWAFFWSVFQSFLHFYYDGFLWKMRLPSVHAHI